jgi:hypothetical protein
MKFLSRATRRPIPRDWFFIPPRRIIWLRRPVPILPLIRPRRHNRWRIPPPRPRRSLSSQQSRLRTFIWIQLKCRCRRIRRFLPPTTLYKSHNHVPEEIADGEDTRPDPPDDGGNVRLVCDEETETTVCETAEDDDTAEPEVDVGEPATVGGTVFDEAGVVVGPETGLNDGRSDDCDAEEVV